MALAEAMSSINKNSFTPFIMGLALQMLHVYGSKNLVDSVLHITSLDGILKV